MLPCACPARDQIQIWCCAFNPSFTFASVKQDRAGSLHQNRLPSGCPRHWVRAGQRRQSRRPLFYGPGDGWIEKIRLDRRRGSFSASAEPYQGDLEGKSAESPERTEIDWRLDITDPTSGCDDPVDNRRHTLDRPARIKRVMMRRSGQEPPDTAPRANPKTTHVMMLIHVLRYPLMPPAPAQSAAKAG